MIPIPQRVLLGPGPSDVPPRVLEAIAHPTIGHLDPVFLQLMDDIRQKLKLVFRTTNEMTLAVSGTGSAGMECLFANLVEPGDKVLIG
ncbi:MAG: alanine-glyoxylate transaminase / serine-glyoxylate transaminase / serine-pyruvate transaminase, partial [Phycisphaerales bacterium]|nr:alanine-glyoxylate transaminase / serine-glyoxylate transaminase / serine-pyruvate transaminase [Phycisphaerales bacterium]